MDSHVARCKVGTLSSKDTYGKNKREAKRVGGEAEGQAHKQRCKQSKGTAGGSVSPALKRPGGRGDRLRLPFLPPPYGPDNESKHMTFKLKAET